MSVISIPRARCRDVSAESWELGQSRHVPMDLITLGPLGRKTALLTDGGRKNPGNVCVPARLRGRERN